MSIESDYLDEQDFYEMCQQYRHAKDVIAPPGLPNASEAYEALKLYIRNMQSKQFADALAANALLIAENRRLKNAIAPFAKIKPSSFYPDDGSENEPYVVMLAKKSFAIDPDFYAMDLVKAKKAIKHGSQS